MSEPTGRIIKMLCPSDNTCASHEKLSGDMRESHARIESIIDRIDDFREAFSEFREEFRTLSRGMIMVESENKQTNKDILNLFEKLSNNESHLIRLEERLMKIEAENLAQERLSSRRFSYMLAIFAAGMAGIVSILPGIK